MATNLDTNVPTNAVHNFNFLDLAVSVALIALAWANALSFLAAIIALLLYVIVRTQLLSKRPGSVHKTLLHAALDKFVVDSDRNTEATVFLDSDFRRRRHIGHLRYSSKFETAFNDSEYAYRIDGTRVFLRLVEDSFEGIGTQKYWNVRDGVVMESEVRLNRTQLEIKTGGDIEHVLADLRKHVDWTELENIGMNSLKYFILAKKLPAEDARHYFRSELERLKSGCALFMLELEKAGIEPGDETGYTAKASRPTKPTDDDWLALRQAAEKGGITAVEFTERKRLMGYLEKLLA